jgi:hypothetical protein
MQRAKCGVSHRRSYYNDKRSLIENLPKHLDDFLQKQHVYSCGVGGGQLLELPFVLIRASTIYRILGKMTTVVDEAEGKGSVQARRVW